MDTRTIVWTAGLVRRTRKLKAALKAWHKVDRAKGFGNPNFEDWLRIRIEDMEKGIHDDNLLSPANLVKALEVCAIGDPLALKFATAAAKKGGFQTDTNCYLEEGMVNASVWVKHIVLDAVKTKAEEIAEKFREKGYAVDVCVNEEDASEITVNGTIDFDKYLELQKKGGR